MFKNIVACWFACSVQNRNMYDWKVYIQVKLS